MQDLPGRPLTGSEIPVGKKSMWVERPQGDWLNPINMAKLKHAVILEAKTVILDGNTFDITYGIMWDLPASGETRECVKLRKRGPGPQVPFGYVAMKTIMNFEFEEKK